MVLYRVYNKFLHTYEINEILYWKKSIIILITVPIIGDYFRMPGFTEPYCIDFNCTKEEFESGKVHMWCSQGYFTINEKVALFELNKCLNETSRN